MVNRTLIFGFKGNISEEVAMQLSDFDDIHILESSKDSIDSFVEICAKLRPDKILGLGMYSRVDQDKIRIETQCSNAFKKKPARVITQEIPYWFRKQGAFTLAAGIGNSYCNYISFKLVNELVGTPYTFLHIPKTFDAKIATLLVIKQLSIYK